VDGVAAQIAPLLQPGNVVMALQNGLGAGERVARHIPEAHIVIGIAEGFGSSIPKAGHVHHEGMRLIRIGEMNGGMTERVQELEQLWLDAGFNVRAFADINVMIWEKFLCNVTLSAPCAVFDVTVGELMADPEAWKVALGCTAEAINSRWRRASNSHSTTRCGTCPNSQPPYRTPARLYALTI
jgi:2-dehydropantoate 2-reductase